MNTCYIKDVCWWKSEVVLPKPGRLVLVSGGIAKHQDGVWYTETGQDHGRPIIWNVDFWAEMPEAPNFQVQRPAESGSDAT